MVEGDVGDGVLDHELGLPLAAAVGVADGGEDGVDFLDELGLLVGRHGVVAGVDGAGVVFAGEVGVGVFVAQDPGFALGDDFVAEFTRGEGVAPVFEGAFGELHDVALVDKGEALAFFAQGVFDCAADEALGAFSADGLDAEA
jgi:hypothetical protein